MQLKTAGRQLSKYSLSWLERIRWNVLDLMQIVGKNSIATYLFCDIDMTWAEELRKTLQAAGHKTTVNAIMLKAIGIAQRKHPDSRTVLLPWGRVATLNQIVAGVTVEKFIDGRPAVYFAAIKDPDTKSVEQIAAELREYGQGDVTEVPHLATQHRFTNMPWLLRRLILWLGTSHPFIRMRYMGATFGFSTLGRFKLQAIIPPCVTTSTLGVGGVEDRAVVRNGQVQVRPMITMTLNFDHRLIDGGPAARFLEDVRLLMEGGLAEYTQEPETSFAPSAGSMVPIA